MLSRLLPASRLRAPRLQVPSIRGSRPFTSGPVRFNAEKAPSSFKEGISRYKLFVSPFAKVFLGAIFTFQVITWTWRKLELDELKFEKNQEVAALEKEARALTAQAVQKK